MPIPLDCIDVYWTKLYMCTPAPINPEVFDDLDSRLAEELDTINQHFSVSNQSEKIMLLKRLRELVTPTTSSLIELEVKIQKCNKRVSKIEASICRIPSKFEKVSSAEDSCPTPTSRNLNQSSTKLFRRSKKKVLFCIHVGFNTFSSNYYIF